jgi:adenosylcobinamide kinase/adenosylcobinamide-phosphate guanylyltransferase
MLTLVTGGARSGKSRFAERFAACGHQAGVYIATAQIFDEEMRERIALHRRQREAAPFPWETVEEPYELSALLRRMGENASDARVVLVDCLTLWLSNWLLRFEREPDAAERVSAKTDELAETAAAFPGDLVLVTNEVGSGIVPEYPLGRLYRDLSGKMNQRIAEASGQVFLVTAGIPIELKSRAYRFPDE